MKKIISIALALVLFAVPAFAASSMIPTIKFYQSQDEKIRIIKVACVAHTDGAFSPVLQITDADSTKPYYDQGYVLGHAWAVNDATTYPASGALTLTDESGQQIVGTNAGDTLTLSTAASGVGYLSIDRGSKQRSVVSKLTVAWSTTTTNGSIFTLYLLLSK
jgi:hypothetical protein